MKKLPPLVCLIIITFLAMGCSLVQEIHLDGKGGGTSTTRFDIKDFYLDFLSSFFDVDATIDEAAEELNKNPYISQAVVSRPSKEVITGSFAFTNLESIFQQENEIDQAQVISTSFRNGINTVEIRLNRENFNQLAALIPLLDDPYLASFGPEGSDGLTEADYIEMVQWNFEDLEKFPGESVIAFKNSFLIMRVKVDGEILSQTGGVKLSSRIVEYRIPLVKLLILEDELYYQLKYRQ